VEKKKICWSARKEKKEKRNIRTRHFARQVDVAKTVTIVARGHEHVFTAVPADRPTWQDTSVDLDVDRQRARCSQRKDDVDGLRRFYMTNYFKNPFLFLLNEPFEPWVSLR